MLELSGALIWANINYDSYHHIVDMVLIDHFFVGHLHDGHRTLTLHYLINDVLMALFFAIAGESMGGRGLKVRFPPEAKKAMTPLDCNCWWDHGASGRISSGSIYGG